MTDTITDVVFATIVPGVHGELAACYWGRARHHGVPLLLLDWSVEQLVPSFWKAALDRLEQLAAETHSRTRHVGAWAEGDVLPHVASGAGLPCRAIPDWLVGDRAWPQLVLSATHYIRARDALLAPLAVTKTQTRAFGGLGFAGGERGEDPTLPAFLYGIVLGLDENAARDPKPRTLVKSARS